MLIFNNNRLKAEGLVLNRGQDQNDENERRFLVLNANQIFLCGQWGSVPGFPIATTGGKRSPTIRLPRNTQKQKDLFFPDFSIHGISRGGLIHLHPLHLRLRLCGR